MKKLFSILLLSLYSFSMMGLWVNVHSCGGIAESIDFLKETDNCCCLVADDVMEDNCCDDETIVLQLDQKANFTIVSANFILSTPLNNLENLKNKDFEIDHEELLDFNFNNENIPILKRPLLINKSLILYS